MSEAIRKNEYMRGLFRYIEENLSAGFGTELLSSVGFVSSPKLYRDFYSMTGHSVKEYVRKRRLSNALALIKTSDMGLTDIALHCGYSSHQALCRAVRQSLGLTPSEYRGGDTYYFFPPFNGNPLQSVTVSNETIPRTLCIRFYHSKLTVIENMAVSAFLQVFSNYSGRIFGRNGKQNGNKFCYELYLTVTEADYSILSERGFEIVNEAPCFSAAFAMSSVQNNEPEINAAWNYLYSEWLQGSMFEYTDEPYYEEYILRNGKPYRLKLFLPVRKRNEDTKISLIGNPGLRFVAARAKGHNAEEIASQIVFDYLMTYRPNVIETSKELYQRKDADSYTCGVRVNSELRVADDENIINIATDQNNYLALESSVMGDYDRYADMLVSFAQDNGMGADIKGIFAVYDGSESFDNLRIKMYCPVRIVIK